MFDVFSRSWQMTKLSFRVVDQDKELLLFPILGGVFSLLYMAALVVPLVIIPLQDPNGVMSVLQYVTIGAVYFGLSFFATFFNVCVVYTTKVRFEGGNATFLESLRFAFSRLGQILYWSLLSASVGLFLHILDQIAERMGGIGGVIIGFLQSLLGMMWSVPVGGERRGSRREGTPDLQPTWPALNQ